MKDKKYLIEGKEGGLTVNVDKMTIYLSPNTFDTETSKWLSNEIEFFANCIVGFTNKTVESLYKLTLDITIVVNFTDTEKVVKNLYGEEEQFIAVNLYRGDLLIENNRKLKGLEPLKEFLNFFMRGKLPPSIPYSDFYDIISNNFSSYGLKEPVAAMIMQIIIGESLRYNKDVTIPYRKHAGKTGDELNYVPIITKKLARYNSVFGGISYEDISSALDEAIDMVKKNKKQNIISAEKTIKY